MRHKLFNCRVNNKDKLPDASFYDEDVLKEPLQDETEKLPFVRQANGQRYKITPVFDYELHGMVVSDHHSDEFGDIYHHDTWADFLNIKDLCVIWGKNVSSGVHQKMDFSNSTWTCWYSWPDRATGEQFNHAQLSNNHLLADDAALNKRILDAKPGDQIYLRGVLANYVNLGNNFQRGTSVSRTDTGNGACETIYVDEFRVVKKANTGWRSLYVFFKVAAIIALIGVIAMAAVTPVRVRH